MNSYARRHEPLHQIGHLLISSFASMRLIRLSTLDLPRRRRADKASVSEWRVTREHSGTEHIYEMPTYVQVDWAPDCAPLAQDLPNVSDMGIYQHLSAPTSQQDNFRLAD